MGSNYVYFLSESQWQKTTMLNSPHTNSDLLTLHLSDFIREINHLGSATE